jgi:glycosyltransferase involved in cell wall biosynthesis
MNVLYLSYDGMTDPLGQSQVIPYLEGLSNAGYSISLISCEKPERYKENHVKIKNTLEKYSIAWYPCVYHKSPPVFSTVYDLYCIYKKTQQLNRIYNFKLIHCRSYLTSIIGLHLKRKKGIPFIFDMRGFWANERIDGKIWNIKNPIFKSIYNYFKAKEKRFIDESAHIISLTELAKTEIETWNVYKKNKIPISVIPCSCDFDLYLKTAPNVIADTKTALKIKNDSFVLSYVGSLGTWYMLDEMLDFYKLLKQQKSNAVFLFLTPDAAEIIYQKVRSKEIDLADIRVLYSNKDKLAQYVSISDYSIFFITPLYSKIASSPTKLGELLSMKIPVITNSGIGDVDEIMRFTEAGIVIKEFNEYEYKTALKKINDIQPNMEEAREKAKDIFNLNKAIRDYIAIYNRISVSRADTYFVPEK